MSLLEGLRIRGLSTCKRVRCALETVLPFLNVSGPDGQQFSVELAKERVTIGRFAQFNEELHHTEAEVNHLIWELRQKLEPDPKEPQFLETVRGLGYRLVTRPLTD